MVSLYGGFTSISLELITSVTNGEYPIPGISKYVPTTDAVQNVFPTVVNKYSVGCVKSVNGSPNLGVNACPFTIPV